MNKKFNINNLRYGILFLIIGICGGSLMIKCANQESIFDIILEMTFAYTAIFGGILILEEWRNLGN